jgi:hypothetical protein
MAQLTLSVYYFAMSGSATVSALVPVLVGGCFTVVAAVIARQPPRESARAAAPIATGSGQGAAMGGPGGAPLA